MLVICLDDMISLVLYECTYINFVKTEEYVVNLFISISNLFKLKEITLL